MLKLQGQEVTHRNGFNLVLSQDLFALALGIGGREWRTNQGLQREELRRRRRRKD